MLSHSHACTQPHLVALLRQRLPVLHKSHDRPSTLPHIDALVATRGLLELKAVAQLLQVGEPAPRRHRLGHRLLVGWLRV
jgi:hypothetical protein